MNILDLARTHATAVTDPERAKRVAEKRERIAAAASEAFEAIKPLSGYQAEYAGQRVRLGVSLQSTNVCVTMHARRIVPYGERKYGNGQPIAVEPGEVWYADTPTVVGMWRVAVVDKGYELHRPVGAVVAASVLDDIVSKVAEDIGPMLVED